MPLIDDVKAVCDRLAPLGWGTLLGAVTRDQLDITKRTSAELKAELQKPLNAIDTSYPGFEDFDSVGAAGVVPGVPSSSLLYHAFASPGVLRDDKGALLRGFPSLAEIELLENLIFGIVPKTLADVVRDAGVAQLSIAVYATEYRPAQDCASGPHADLTFSRTGIARCGTARARYVPEARGFWSEDADNPHAFRVIPIRFTVWLAKPVKGDAAPVMRLDPPDRRELKRTFWVPVHKLFDGPECLSGLDLTLEPSARLFNMKLQRVFESLRPPVKKTGAPYVREDGLARLVERSDDGRLTVVPIEQHSLVEPARNGTEFLTYAVPKHNGGGFAAYSTPSPDRPGFDPEIHPFPAYVHARTAVREDEEDPARKLIVDLNYEDKLQEMVAAGGYDAVLYLDFTGEGWVSVQVPALAGQAGVTSTGRPAYVLLSAPDFFPSAGQRELSRWAASKDIPAPFRDLSNDRSETKLWAVAPDPLSATRLPANLQLPDSPFDSAEDTITAVVGMGDKRGAPPALVPRLDVVRASTLPDDGAGVFGPGWDVSVDVRGPPKTGTPHLAAYGLGSPFPEDAKLCAALSTYWPAVAPDVYRSMSMHTGNTQLRGSVAPLTDAEIGQTGTLPWDGVPGPRIVTDGDEKFVEMASFLRVDYVRHAVENRFSGRLLSRITAEEYARRVLAAARVHHILSGGDDIRNARGEWLFLSFQSASTSDLRLQEAQDQGGYVFKGRIYRVEACYTGRKDLSKPVPGNPRLVRMPLRRLNTFYVSPDDPVALHRDEMDLKFRHVAAE